MARKTKIVNTATSGINHSWLGGGDPDAIVAQEGAGQDQLVESMSLPTDVEVKCRERLEGLGVVFGDQVEGDPLFREATLPKGWEKQATDHNLYTNLVDQDGVVQATIFYKAAFYDRAAFIRDV
jgi:hypothetical protein